MSSKPLYDRTEAELLKQLRTMYDAGNYTSSPNDIARELDRRAAARQARIAMATSIVGVIVAIAAVVLSAIALIAGAG